MALPKLASAKYELTLPSNGEKVEFRPFLVKEEKILLMAQSQGTDKDQIMAIKDIVNNCTFGKLDANNMPFYDLEYVFLQIRAKSVGEVAKLKVLCPDDGKTYANVEIDLAKIEVFVDDDHSPNIMIDEDRKLGVVMRYPALKDVDADTLQGDINIQKTYKMITNRSFGRRASIHAPNLDGCGSEEFSMESWLDAN